ncbi:MAG: hypothetical protein IJC45_10505 [Clostridia bacterium]|nr:hypothetical protein [Clostridia bacterium]
MKKILCTLLAFCLLAGIFTLPIHASETEQTLTCEKILETAHGIYDSDSESEATRANDLIVGNSLTLSKTTSSLVIIARTLCIEDVTKCGFTYIKLQRLINGSWTDYASYCYYDQYANATEKMFSKSITPPSGYTYRVICEHYAEKPRLVIFKDTQTIYNETTTVYF